MQKLMAFEFEIRHIPGSQNVVANALSRSPLPLEPNCVEGNNACFASHTVIPAITELEPPLTLNEISDAQLEDRTLQQFRDEDAHDRETVDWTLSTLLRHINNIFEDGILYIATNTVELFYGHRCTQLYSMKCITLQWQDIKEYGVYVLS